MKRCVGLEDLGEASQNTDPCEPSEGRSVREEGRVRT